MKVLHLCLSSFYIDNHSYQENILPKYHKKLGYNVAIIASLVSFDKNGKPCYLDKESSYKNEYGIPVDRIDYKKSFMNINKILRIYKTDVYDLLEKQAPNIIFIHNCQFWDIHKVAKYAKKHPNVKIFVDNHADFLNSATNWFSKYILHKIVWKHCAKVIEPYTTKFYGVLPARVDFLIDVYKLPKEKVELLVMGADDEKVENAKSSGVRKEIREKYHICDDDFLIMTGGKIDLNKLETVTLMKAVKNLNRKDVKLIVFGSVINQLTDIVKQQCCDTVKYIGWIDSGQVYNYFEAADLVVFPGKHSVLWEQTVGLGKPCLFRYLHGFTHIDLGGNCKFLNDVNENAISSMILSILEDKQTCENMKVIACSKGMDTFSYKKIAQRSIN